MPQWAVSCGAIGHHVHLAPPPVLGEGAVSGREAWERWAAKWAGLAPQTLQM